jgi:hypothetical protein
MIFKTPSVSLKEGLRLNKTLNALYIIMIYSIVDLGFTLFVKQIKSKFPFRGQGYEF